MLAPLVAAVYNPDYEKNSEFNNWGNIIKRNDIKDLNINFNDRICIKTKEGILKHIKYINTLNNINNMVFLLIIVGYCCVLICIVSIRCVSICIVTVCCGSFFIVTVSCVLICIVILYVMY